MNKLELIGLLSISQEPLRWGKRERARARREMEESRGETAVKYAARRRAERRKVNNVR